VVNQSSALVIRQEEHSQKQKWEPWAARKATESPNAVSAESVRSAWASLEHGNPQSWSKKDLLYRMHNTKE